MSLVKPIQEITPPALIVHGDCRKVSRVLARIGDKWSVLIVMLLIGRPHRFNELKREVGGISQRNDQPRRTGEQGSKPCSTEYALNGHWLSVNR